MAKSKFYKTTIVIFTDYDPSGVEIDDLAHNAISGDAICNGSVHEEVEKKDLPEGVASFFNTDEPNDSNEVLSQGLPLSWAFEIGSEDVDTVLQRNEIELPDGQIKEEIMPLLDQNKIAAIAVKAGTEMDEQITAAYDEIERQLMGILPDYNGMSITVVCAICHNPCLKRTAHLHQGEQIGDECCWDERLKASE